MGLVTWNSLIGPNGSATVGAVFTSAASAMPCCTAVLIACTISGTTIVPPPGVPPTGFDTVVATGSGDSTGVDGTVLLSGVNSVTVPRGLPFESMLPTADHGNQSRAIAASIIALVISTYLPPLLEAMSFRFATSV